MEKSFWVFLIFVLFLSSSALGNSNIDFSFDEQKFINEHPVIRVNNNIDCIPYSFFKNGKAQGYTIDYLNLLGDKIGVKFEFISGPNWNDFLWMLKNKQIDIISNLVKTKDRQSYSLFTHPVLRYIPILISQKNLIANKLEDLNGKILAVVDGQWYKEAIETHYPQIQLHIVNSNEEALKAVNFGDVDAVVGDGAILQNIWIENHYSNLKVAGEALLPILEPYYKSIGVRDDWYIFRSILNKTIDSIEFHEINKLKRKWVLSDVSFTTNIKLTDEELKFINEHPIIKVHNEQSWIPFNFNTGGVPKGFIVDVINILAKKIGIKIEYISGHTWDEFVKLLQTKQIDVIANMVYTTDREKFALFTEPLLTQYSSILSHIHNPFLSMNDLKGKKVAVVKGHWYESLLNKYYPEIKIITTKNTLENVKAVAFGKADAAIGAGPVLQHLIYDNNLSMLTISDEIVLRGDSKPQARIAVRKDWPILKGMFDKAINSLSYKELHALKEKWGVVNNSIVNPIKLSDDELNFISNHHVLRVHNEEFWPPFNYNKDGIAKGFSIDYLNLIAKKAGFYIEYVRVPLWSELITKVKNKELDVVLNVVNTPERQKFLLFTDSYIRNPNVIISRDDAIIDKIEDLNGKTVAIPRGFFYEEILKSDYPDIHLLLKDNVDDILKAVTFKKADAAFAELAVVDYFIKNKMYTNLHMSGEIILGNFSTQDLCIGIRNDWPQLQSIFKKVMSEINNDEILKLKKKWLTYEIEENDSAVNFSFEEEKYLRNKGSIIIGVHPNNLPYDQIDENGKFVGIAADFIDILQAKIPIPIKLQSTSKWKDTLKNFHNKRCDMIPLIKETKSDYNDMLFSKTYFTDPIVIVAHNNVIYLDGLESLSGKKVALIKGEDYREVIKSKYPGIEIVDVDSLENALRAVSEGKVYATLGSILSLTRGIQKYGFSNIKLAGKTDLDNSFKIGVCKDNTLLLSILNKVIDSIDEKTTNSILRSWYTVNLQHKYDWALFLKVFAVAVVIVGLLLYIVFSTHKFNKKLTEANKELKRLSITDKLTGLNNRVKLNDSFAKELSRFNRFHHSLGVILFDIDHFKSVNDTYGHNAGDEVLINVATILKNCTRETDIPGRWGGEEFLVICPETDLSGLKHLAENIRISLETFDFPTVNKVTASFGVSLAKGDDTMVTLIERSDKALYAAKQSGRNRICVG